MKTSLLIFLLGTVVCFGQEQWTETTRKAAELEGAGKWEEALLLRKNSVESAASADKNTKLYLKALQKVTQAELSLRTTTDYKQALDMMLSGAEDLVTSKAEPIEISKVYRRLGMLSHNYFRNMEDTYSFTLKSVEHHQQSKEKDSAILLRTYHSLGVVSRQLGRLEESLNHFNRLLDLYDNISVKDTNMLASTYRDLAMLYGERFLDIPTKASEYLTRSRNTFESVQAPNLNYLVVVYMELGMLEAKLGNYSTAEGFLNKGIQLYRDNKEKTQSFRQGDLRNMIEIQYNHYLISLYTSSMNEKKMLNALTNVETIEKQNEMSSLEYDQYVSCLNLIGMYFTKKQPEKAIPYFEKALYLNKKYKERDFTTEASTNLANAYFYKNDYLKSLSLVEPFENNPTVELFIQKRIQALKAKTFFSLNEPDSAITELQKLISKISTEKFDIRTGKVKDYKPGFVLQDNRFYLDIAESINTSESYLEPIKGKLLWLALIQFEQNIGNQPLTKPLEENYEEIISKLMDIAITRNFSLKENNLLLSAIENIESRFLLNKMLLKRALASNKSAESYIEKEQLLRSNITFLYKKYYEHKDEKLKQIIFEEEQKLKKLEDDFRDENPAYANFFSQKYVFSDFNLPKDRLYLKFKRTEDNLFKITIDGNKISYTKINNYNKLRKLISGFQENLTDVSVSNDILKKDGEAIYKQLFPENLSEPYKHIVIIPDDILYFLPFELLIKNNNYLIKEYSFSYSVGWAYLGNNLIKKNVSHQDNIVFFAPSYDNVSMENHEGLQRSPVSLQGTRKEVEEISKLINGKVFIAGQALKSNFKLATENVAVIHLSMHSFLNDENPELNNLAFSSNEEDSRLYISELYGYTFNSDLAVLSACSTGIGDFKDGGSLISMSHAFTFAGVPATVSSLWNVPDQSTKKLMVLFYKHLTAGKSKSESLRNAKLDYLNTARISGLQHPFYWAGFVAYGNDEPVIFKDRSALLLVAPLACSVSLLALATVFYIRKRQTQRRQIL